MRNSSQIRKPCHGLKMHGSPNLLNVTLESCSLIIEATAQLSWQRRLWATTRVASRQFVDYSFCIICGAWKCDCILRRLLVKVFSKYFRHLRFRRQPSRAADRPA